ncbi:MAG TPA: ion channel [Bryobacteraceae bacterium]|nr:ion channel [Bryobacteraceae bacterium]
MAQPNFDPGLTTQYTGRLRRSINPDGSFNVKRPTRLFGDNALYLRLINMGWVPFLALVFLSYVVVNLVFALIYLGIGVENLKGSDVWMPGSPFWAAFYFSAQTLTTVGYGAIAPQGHPANAVAAVEAMMGWLGLAFATGLLYGRFSRPQARLEFSEKLLIAPYQGATAAMFRVANRRPNVLMELSATVLLMTVNRCETGLKRDFAELSLERQGIYFLPLSWTVVHPINPDSPLFGLSQQDLVDRESEFLILIRCFDDTFSQTLQARYGYTVDDIVWGGKFQPAFHVDGEGDFVLDLDQLHLHSNVQLPESAVRDGASESSLSGNASPNGSQADV